MPFEKLSRILKPHFANRPAAMALIGWATLVASLWSALAGELAWQTDGLRLAVNTNGALAAITRRSDGKDVLATGGPAYLLSLRNGGSFHAPDRAEWEAASGRLTLHYTKIRATAQVTIVARPTHLTLGLVQIQPAGCADAVQWGPFPTTLRKTVGEVVGVVRDDGFALGLQALNPKTLGGVPENDEGNADRPYAAQATAGGSVLQAYSLDRSRPRSLAVWGKRAPNMPVTPIPGETVVGSKIALFGCAEADALATIGRIEVAEGLPHPMINGVWAKVSPERGRSYLIADYSEADIDELLGYVKRANLMSLYHGNLFKSWGHYEPNPKFFPNGVAGVKACVTKATALGIRLGAHTLSDFIQTHDAYVSPVPDPRLLRTGSSELVDAVEATAGTITVVSPEYFAQEDRNELHTVLIGQELIRYRAVSREAPWRLLDCQRGAYGTTAAPHRAGDSVGKLMDHSYKVFFPDLDLLREIAGNLARVFNATGLSHMDFDGHEGCLAPGQGTYGNELFAKEFHDRLDHTVINGTSPPLSHFYWHFNSYCNWGEPWYGGFRDSMQEYRINNQAFCERNYIPKMLGWYLLTPTTCLSDMEWMLARAAGFDAGFALATSPASLRRNPETARLLDALREWENARRSGAFPTGLREQLRNPKREFHLEPIAAGVWDIFPFHDSPEFTHVHAERQPGEPTSARWELTNPDQSQALQFKLRVVGSGGAITNAVIEVGPSAALQLPVEVRAGHTLLVEGDAIARVYDAHGRQVSAVPLKAHLPTVERGTNSIQFDCEFQGDVPPKAIVTFKTKGAPERVRSLASQ